MNLWSLSGTGIEVIDRIMSSLVLVPVLDSAGKLPSGVLLGNIAWRGSYEQCVNVTAVMYDNITAKTNPRYPFKGRYCRLSAILNDPNATAPPAAGGINGLVSCCR